MRFGFTIFQTEPISKIVELAQLLESYGFDTAWTGDSQMIWREAYITLGAIAAGTRSIKFGTGVTNPVTRHPAVIASGWSSLAELSGGRAILGIGLGDSALETMGLKPARMKELEETIDVVRSLIGGETIDYQGHSIKLNHAWKQPVPVYIAASGPKMLELSGRIADGIIMLVGTHPRFVQAALQKAGSNKDTVLWCPFSIGRDGKTAKDNVRPHVARAVLHPMPFEFSPEDQMAIEDIRNHYDYYSHLAVGAPQGRVVPDSLVDQFAIAGTPEECREQVRRLMDSGVGQVALIPHGADRAGQIRTFAEEVMARL